MKPSKEVLSRWGKIFATILMGATVFAVLVDATDWRIAGRLGIVFTAIAVMVTIMGTLIISPLTKLPKDFRVFLATVGGVIAALAITPVYFPGIYIAFLPVAVIGFLILESLML